MGNIQEIINSFFGVISNISSSLSSEIGNCLDSVVFLDETAINNGIIKCYLEAIPNMKIGMIQIAKTCFLIYIIYFSYKFLTSRLTGELNENLYEFFYKALFTYILIEFSLWFCTSFLNINSTITNWIKYVGETYMEGEISFKALFLKIDKHIKMKPDIGGINLNFIIRVFTSYACVNMVFMYALRLIYIYLYVVFSPIIILTRISKKTSYIFENWIKSFFGLIFLQNVIVIVLRLTLSLSGGGETIFQKVVLIGCLYAMLHINDLVKEICGGTNINFSNGFLRMFGGIYGRI